MKALPEISAGIGAHRPRILHAADRDRAAVAAILREQDGDVEILFIERATVDGDPWSGHIAFPGGRLEDADSDVEQTARRETLEEVGLDLSTAACIGQLDDVAAHIDPIRVSGFVFQLSGVPPFTYSDEVQQAFWFPLNRLTESGRHLTLRIPEEPGVREMPAIDLLGPGRTPLWGLTYRFVRQLVKLTGETLP